MEVVYQLIKLRLYETSTLPKRYEEIRGQALRLSQRVIVAGDTYTWKIVRSVANEEGAHAPTVCLRIRASDSTGNFAEDDFDLLTQPRKLDFLPHFLCSKDTLQLRLASDDNNMADTLAWLIYWQHELGNQWPETFADFDGGGIFDMWVSAGGKRRFVFKLDHGMKRIAIKDRSGCSYYFPMGGPFDRTPPQKSESWKP